MWWDSKEYDVYLLYIKTDAKNFLYICICILFLYMDHFECIEYVCWETFCTLAPLHYLVTSEQ